ncbi:MFS transporter [Alteromonas sp. a30]|nr:MFS transporter [Alteromonas sp. a30]
MGVIAPYLGVFLDGRGLSSGDIGSLVAIITIARLIAPNLWAAFADKSGKSLVIIRVGAMCAFVSFLSLFWATGYVGIALALAISVGFWTSIVPQLEQITLKAIQGDSAYYSRIRMWGSIGFILMSVVCGWLMDYYGSEVTLLCSAAMLLSLCVATFLIKGEASIQHQLNTASIKNKVLSRPFLVFIAVMMMLQMSFGAYYSFFALYMRDLGFDGRETGWLVSLGVVAEVVIFVWAGKITQAIGIQRCLVICLIMTALRWGILAVAPQVLVLLLVSQSIHAFSFALAHTAAIKFVHEHFGERFQSRGQALYVSISFGFGGAVGSFIAGQYWQQGAGAQTAWLISVAMAAVGAFIALWLPVKHPLTR